MKATFKVHKVSASLGQELVTLHFLDPHEMKAPNTNELALESRSGEGKLQLKITAPAALKQFEVGDLVDVELTVRK